MKKIIIKPTYGEGTPNVEIAEKVNEIIDFLKNECGKPCDVKQDTSDRETLDKNSSTEDLLKFAKSYGYGADDGLDASPSWMSQELDNRGCGNKQDTFEKQHIGDVSLCECSCHTEGNGADKMACDKCYRKHNWKPKQDTSNNWEKKFDEEFEWRDNPLYVYADDLKDFIRTEKEKSFEEGRKEGYIKGLAQQAQENCIVEMDEQLKQAKQETIKAVEEFIDGTIPDATISNEYYLRKDTIKSFLNTIK